MFKRFISISHLGRFETRTALGAHEFLKWNIIYGKNGKGKSTLTALLKSVGENQPNYLLSRKTLGQPNTPNAKLLFINDTDGSSISVEFNGITWDQTPQKILVFDQDFIDTNIFIGTHVDYAQKRGLYEIFVGRQTGSLVKQISIEDEKIKKINPEINSTRTQISYNIKSTLSIEDFMKLPKPSSGENLIPTLEKQIKAIQNKTTIMQKPLQQELLYSLPNIDKLDTILQTSVKTIADNVTQAIKTKVAIIDEQDAETWMEKGHKFSQKTQGKCPYCWQAMSESELLNQYEEYFNQEYKNALSTLRAYKEEVLQKFNGNSLITLSRIISENEERFKYWQSLAVKELQNMEFGIDELQSLLTELRKLTKDTLDKKLQNPLIPVTIPKQLSAVIDKISEKSDELKEYNDVIKNNNKLIVSFKKNLMGSDNVVDLRTKLYTEQDQYNRHTPSIDSLCKKYETLINLKVKYEAIKSKLRLQLDESSQKILEEHQKSINDCLIRSGASFSLHRIDQSHLGGRPNSTFVLEINGEEIPADSEAEDSPSLKTALSTGDRTTLAFAFFVSCALQDNDLNKTILVIDDPISSLDYERRNHTVNIIFDLFSRCSQGLLLSHDPDFLHDIWCKMGANPRQRASFQIKRTGQRASTLDQWEVEKYAESLQKIRIGTLQTFIDNGLKNDQTLEQIITHIRPTLEHAYKAIYPKEFPSATPLGGFISNIKISTEPYLSNIQRRLDRLIIINEYVTPYSSHDPSTTASSINETELSTKVKETLELIRS